MKIGTLESKNGQKVYEKIVVTETRGRFPVEIPVHIIEGSKPGKTLAIIAGVSGLELESIPALHRAIEKIDPLKMKGTLIVVPLLNISGFEFEQINAIWDDKDLHTLGRGDAEGSVSEILVDFCFRQIICQSDAVIEFRTGALWSYSKYAGVYKIGDVKKSMDLAYSMGLPQVLLGEPAGDEMISEAVKDGKIGVTAWVGGGPGHRDFKEDHLDLIENGIFNAMKHLDIMSGPAEPGDVMVLDGHSFIGVEGPRGFTFMDKTKRGQAVRAGEVIGYVKHPFTGDCVYEYKVPLDGVLLDAGVSWPLIPEDAVIAIIGNKI